MSKKYCVDCKWYKQWKPTKVMGCWHENNFSLVDKYPTHHPGSLRTKGTWELKTCGPDGDWWEDKDD